MSAFGSNWSEWVDRTRDLQGSPPPGRTVLHEEVPIGHAWIMKPEIKAARPMRPARTSVSATAGSANRGAARDLAASPTGMPHA